MMLPLAKLQIIDLALLQDGDNGEIRRLLEASRENGIFYLNLQCIEGKMSTIIDTLYELTRGLYDMPYEEKMMYDVDKLGEMKCNGYKPVGRNFGGLSAQRDGFETYAIPKSGILGLEGHQDFSRPFIIDKYMGTLKDFTQTVHSIADTVNDSLSSALQIPQSANLKLFHRLNAPSSDILRLLKYQAQPIEQRGAPHAAHTDLGTLTFLFTEQPGLQICTTSTNDWEWVLPMKNHAIVNLGDSMSLLTNGYLRSCIHKVGPLPNTAMPTRYSFAYMVRPEDQTPMTGQETSLIPPRVSNEPILTGAQWLRKKFKVLRSELRPTDQDWVMTGQQL
ncbi:hypothetical protein N7537_006983 [Penicillium hordei]|uniref:Fe2OG dioxygenase domain-containing protein n=1 Tax=Penicillium hordei TaxID=40994 RepID=A0AAD6E9T6_9EURO|nr:uncharacterized protein N7537_006983 [Penicillium hordei]KAJ5604027.1 hypothetical protein N7537_006983 [Penicillium hordei]